MSIAIRFVLSAGIFDGITPYVFAAADWTNEGGGLFTARPPGPRLGIVDPRAILQGLTTQFGRFLEPTSPDVGSTVKITDLLMERAIMFTGGQTAQEIGTHSAAGQGGVAGRRLRQGPAFITTETVGAYQAGGVGQVAHTLFADGQAGVMMIPTSQRVYVLSNVAAGNHQLAMWLVPIYAPRDVALVADAGQPLPQFA